MERTERDFSCHRCGGGGGFLMCGPLLEKRSFRQTANNILSVVLVSSMRIFSVSPVFVVVVVG